MTTMCCHRSGEICRSSLRRRGAAFIMGFNAEGDVHETIPFERVIRLRVAPPGILLRAFFGCGHELSRHSLPFSPICCLTSTGRLREWMGELRQFITGRPLRNHFMMERNAGPDLMIYLLSILNHPGPIAVFDGPVAQFSAHQASITSGLEPTDLPIGYWLAGVWLSDRLRKLGRNSEAGWCAAYSVRQGLRLVLRRLRRRRGKWFASLLREIAGLAARSLAGPAALPFLKSFIFLLGPRAWRPQFGLSIRDETLLA